MISRQTLSLALPSFISIFCICWEQEITNRMQSLLEAVFWRVDVNYCPFALPQGFSHLIGTHFRDFVRVINMFPKKCRIYYNPPVAISSIEWVGLTPRKSLHSSEKWDVDSLKTIPAGLWTAMKTNDSHRGPHPAQPLHHNWRPLRFFGRTADGQGMFLVTEVGPNPHKSIKISHKDLRSSWFMIHNHDL